ncbi:hypothetical protein H8356DRAFT_1312724 [Neocallimastix lanati (nom. inval.)]|nr:hypothetical protein H8356DRAFT_1312724 [Neocallimastix sp. JGI-2020a]
MRFISCLPLIAIVCSSTLVNGRSICVVKKNSTSNSNSNSNSSFNSTSNSISNSSFNSTSNSISNSSFNSTSNSISNSSFNSTSNSISNSSFNSTSNSPSNKKYYVQNSGVEDSSEKPTLEELEDLIEECEPGSFSNMGINKYCESTYKSKTCQKLFNYIPDIYDYALSDRYTVYKAGYTISLAKAICENDEDDSLCPITGYFYDVQSEREGTKISDYVKESCESPKCLEKTKELLSARDTYLLYKYENEEETYNALKKEQEEVKEVLEQCSKKSDEEDSSEKPTLEELEDLIEECEPGSFSNMGINKYCESTYKSKTCQKLFNYIPDIYDYALSDRYTVYKAGYTISLAKAICENDEDDSLCPITGYFYDVQSEREGTKISDYVKESCESPKCLEKTKELLSARDTFLLYKYKNEEETYNALKKEQEEVKEILEQCSKKSDEENSSEKPTLEELEDLIEECEPGSFSNMGINKYCESTYKSKTCQKLFNYIPDIYDYALSDRYTVYKAGYTISLAKAICENDEDDSLCPITGYFYDVQSEREGTKISDYVKESCESPKCLKKTKELLSARDTFLLYKYKNEEETYNALKKEQEEVKEVLEQCSKKSDEEDSSEKPTLEELEDLIEECEPGSFSNMGINKYCESTYKSKTCQKLFNYIPDIYDYALSDRYTVYKAGYTISLAKAICENDEDDSLCPITGYFYDVQSEREGTKISDYVKESCESPKCLEKTKELLSARDTFLLYKYENEEETYNALKKEQEEVKEVLEQCSKKSDEEDSSEKPTLEELEDLIEECEPGSFSNMGINKYCESTYKSKTCQKLFNYIPDIYDYALSDRYTVYKAGYTISLAKAICENDEDGSLCPITGYFYDVQSEREGTKISDYVKESCESPKCLEKTKELLSARDTYLLYKYENEEETYNALKKEQEEIKKLLKKC